MKLLIKNIKELVQVEEEPRLKVAGLEMANLSTVTNAWLAIEGDLIVAYGSMDNWGGITNWGELQVIDAEGRMVFPCWCDSHTHIVYAGSREDEFVDRIKGLSYEEIATKGGGILNSATRLQETSEDELVESAMRRLKEVMLQGTGAIEIKSGYGLTVEAELKILRVIKKLKEISPVTIRSTFLGAHAYPLEYRDDHEGYLNLIINEMLPVIADEGLADHIDAFCETGYYSVDETERVLRAGIEAGLKPKVHVNQFTAIGGVGMCVRNKSISVDHLEVMDTVDFESLDGSDTIPTLLPSCSFFLRIPYGPAREMIDRGLAVALATDFNPGSTPSGNMNFVVSLGCIQMNMTPEEAINAATVNGAYAMELSQTHGSIAVGKKANVFITKEIPSYAYLPYAFGSDLIDTVIINGEIQQR